MPMRLVRRKQSKLVVEEENKKTINDDFKKQLSLILGTPQGREIRDRNWRVSDKFMGGKRIEDYRSEKALQREREAEREESTFRAKSSRSGKTRRNNEFL